jgi:hypothetical protein
VFPLVKQITLSPVARPLTPEPTRPLKSLAAPAPLYVLKLTLTPPRLMSLGMALAALLVRGKYSRLTGAAVLDISQPVKTIAQSTVVKGKFNQLNLMGIAGQTKGWCAFMCFIVG